MYTNLRYSSLALRILNWVYTDLRYSSLTLRILDWVYTDLRYSSLALRILDWVYTDLRYSSLALRILDWVYTYGIPNIRTGRSILKLVKKNCCRVTKIICLETKFPLCFRMK